MADPDPEKGKDASVLHFENNVLLDEQGQNVHPSTDDIDTIQKMIDGGELELFTLDDQSRAWRWRKPDGTEEIFLENVITVQDPDQVQIEYSPAEAQQVENAIQAEQDDKDEDPDWVPEDEERETPPPQPSKGKGKGKTSKIFQQKNQKQLDEIASKTVSENTKDQTKWAVRKFKGMYIVYVYRA